MWHKKHGENKWINGLVFYKSVMYKTARSQNADEKITLLTFTLLLACINFIVSLLSIYLEKKIVSPPPPHKKKY
jgi:hypothetical protein